MVEGAVTEAVIARGEDEAEEAGENDDIFGASAVGVVGAVVVVGVFVAQQ